MFQELLTNTSSEVQHLLTAAYARLGMPGVTLCFLMVMGLASLLIYWQVQRQGRQRTLLFYTVCAVLGVVMHLGFGDSAALPTNSLALNAPATQSASGVSSLQAKANSGKLSSLERRIKSQDVSIDARARAPQPVLESESGTLLESWDRNRGSTFAIAILVCAGIIFLIRSFPALFQIEKIRSAFRMSSDWIRPQRSESNELGSSDLANAKQIRRWLKRKGKHDTILPITELRGSEGQAVKSGELVIPIGERNRHILIVAKTGSGKTTKLVLPILYNDCMCPHRSTIIIDSKQEMWHKLAGMTRKYNPEKKVVLFNPLDAMRSLSWNILSKVESDTDCKLIANSVIMATDEPQAKADSPFFRNSALQVLNSVMVGLLNDPEERLSMPRIHELMSQGMHGLCDWLEAHPHAIRTSKAFVELARSGSQNADTIMSELSMRLQAWDLQTIRATTFHDEIDIEAIVREPTLFVVELRESELKMLRPLANVIVVELLRYLTKYAEECPGQCLPRPVGLVIDEFASALGRLPDIHVKLNTLRSRNVSIVAAIQSIGQIKGNYGEDWESVLSGFSTKIFMPSLDFMDSEWASKESGMMTIRFKTSSKGSNRRIVDNFANRNTGTNEQIQQRQVLTPGEIGRPTGNQATFFMPETPVFQGHLTPYYKIPEMLARINEFNDPSREVKLREGMIDYEEKLPEAVVKTAAPAADAAAANAAPAASPQQVNEEDVWKALEEIKQQELDWANTTGDARKWWDAFEEENRSRIALVLKVAQEISKRKASITDFFLAYVYSNTDNIQATLAYLDYTLHMKSADAR